MADFITFLGLSVMVIVGTVAALALIFTVVSAIESWWSGV